MVNDKEITLLGWKKDKRDDDKKNSLMILK